MRYHYKGVIGHFIFLITAFVSILSNRAGAQDNLENIIREMLINDYPVTYIHDYMQPFATAFGTTVISGINHRAYVKEFPHGIIQLIIEYKINIISEIEFASRYCRAKKICITDISAEFRYVLRI